MEWQFVPPSGMSFREAAHEASKILLADGMVIGATPIDDWMKKQLASFPLLSDISGVSIAGTECRIEAMTAR